MIEGGAARLRVTEDDAGRRLDALVRRRFGLPRSLAMKLIRTGAVRVNGRRAEPSRAVAIGDEVEVRGLRERARARPAAAHAGLAARAAARPDGGARALPGAILFEDADLVVFDKPAGLVAHAGTGHERGAAEILVEDYLGIRETEPGASRPALVHRLDRDTSGLLILAKTQLALRRLNAALRSGEVRKAYVALVRGVPEPPEGEIRAALLKARDAPGGPERMRVVAEAAGLPALTRYRVRRAVAGGRAALVDLDLATGRTHQLRAHLAWKGHPIALDRKYGDPRFNAEIAARAGLGRLFLHAGSLRFRHPRTGEIVRVEAPLARDLAEALRRLDPERQADGGA